MRIPGLAILSVGERYNRAARVLAAWVRDADFADASGNPRELAISAPGAIGACTFAELARRYSGDIPCRAVLDELIRVGAVETTPTGAVRIKLRADVPQSAADTTSDKNSILGTDTSDLVNTIGRDGQARFQRKVMYDNVPAEALDEFRRLAAQQAQQLLEHMDQWLARHDRDTNAAAGGTGRMRTGIGIYYVEDNLAAQGV
jgi:hypothetical protein